ncbi:MAG TPA: VWA domain-containing protein, partial [Bacillota bacterium]|nr:VWA domain-containing protein [Bacillota bacterium]
MQKGHFRRVLAVFLSLVMISGMVFTGAPVFATEADSEPSGVTEETPQTSATATESTETEGKADEVSESTASTKPEANGSEVASNASSQTEPEELQSTESTGNTEPEATKGEEVSENPEIIEDNPDHLDAPDSSPYAGKIYYNIQPLTPFPALAALQKNLTRQNRANNPPVIGTDHPANPGDVMLFKQATPVAGMVNTWEVTLRIEGKDTVKTSDIVLVIDTSGSMNDNGRMAAARNAANQFVDTLLAPNSASAATTRIAVVSFAEYAQLKIGLTNDAEALHTSINGLRASGGTFTQAGVKQAEALLAVHNSTADNKHIVLLSDGVPTYSYEIPDNTTRRNGYVLIGDQYYVTGAEYASSAYGTTKVGSGSSITEYIERYNRRNAYYHHGNSAIAEAGFAKSSSR